MTAPPWFVELLGWKPLSNRSAAAASGREWAPNIADVGNKTSTDIATAVLQHLGVTREIPAKSREAAEESRGAALERAVRDELEARLPLLDADRPWAVMRGADIHRFEQYQHLSGLSELLRREPSLRVTLGTDYQIAPDVTVAIEVPGEPLHAVVSCKWTLRSDRAQNVRHEFNLLVRSRRGRTPHLVAVTAEPLPSRLAFLTRGTGEIDAVYHVAFTEMEAAVAAHGTKPRKRTEPSQLEFWEEMTGQRRLRDYSSLSTDLATR